MGDEERVKMELTKEDIKAAPMDEKMNFLIDIAFGNYKRTSEIYKTLNGNGCRGLCDRVYANETWIKVLWIFISALILTMASGFLK